MASRNTYKEDEIYEENFDIRHLLLAGAYIKKYIKYIYNKAMVILLYIIRVLGLILMRDTAKI